MNSINEKEIRWGLPEIFLVYFGVILFAYLFGFYGQGFYDFLVNNLALPERMSTYFILSSFLQFFVMFSLAIVFTIFLNGAKLRDLGLNTPSWDDVIKYGILGGVLLFIFVLLVGILIQFFQPDLEPQYIEKMLRSVVSKQEFFLIFFVGVVLAPISEEIFFRGMLYPVLRKYLGVFWGIVLAGSIFGLAHMDLMRAVPIGIGGMVLCYMYERSSSIWVPIIAHAVWNGLMSVVIYLSITQIAL